MIFAGIPAIATFDIANDFVTTELAPITEPSAIYTPFKIKASEPTQICFPNLTSCFGFKNFQCVIDFFFI